MRSSYGTPPPLQGTRAPGHNCDEPCVGAVSAPSACTCSCRGRHHGAQRATHGPATAARADERALRLAQAFSAPDDADEAF